MPFSDLFYTPKQKKRLRSNKVGRGVLSYIDFTGIWLSPKAQREHRHDLATAKPPHKGRHRPSLFRMKGR